MKRSFDVAAGGSSAPSGSASASGPSGSGQEGQSKRRRRGLETPEKVREYRQGKEKSQAMRDIHAWYAQEERRKAQLYQKRKDEQEVKRRNEERQRIIEEASALATRLAHEQTITLTNRFIDRMSQGASFEEARNQLATDIDERSETLRRSIQDSLNQSFPPEVLDVVSSPPTVSSPIQQPSPPPQVQDLPSQSPEPVPSPSPITSPPPPSPIPAAQSPPLAAAQSPPPAAAQSPPPAAPQSPPSAAPQSSAPSAPAAQPLPQRRRPGNPGRRSTRLAMLTEASSAFLKVGPYTDRLRTRPLMPRKYTA